MADSSITFGVQVGLESKQQLLDTARRVESQGFEWLTLGDHPGSSATPFPSLGAAAAVTQSIRLGPYVANAGLRSPIDLAADTATLDVLSDGRAFLGLGAGHTPAEWSNQGRRRPNAADRVRDLIETADAVVALLGGETVTFSGRQIRLDAAALEAPQPVQERVPLLIGGTNRELLRYAGEKADVVAFSGLGRTLPDGHRHEVRWSRTQIDARVRIAEEAASQRPHPPLRQALVQLVSVTNDRRAEATELATRIGLDVDAVLDAPYVLIGTIEQMVEQLAVSRERWGITSYMVRESGGDVIAALIERLGGPAA